MVAVVLIGTSYLLVNAVVITILIVVIGLGSADVSAAA